MYNTNSTVITECIFCTVLAEAATTTATLTSIRDESDTVHESMYVSLSVLQIQMCKKLQFIQDCLTIASYIVFETE